MNITELAGPNDGCDSTVSQLKMTSGEPRFFFGSPSTGGDRTLPESPPMGDGYLHGQDSERRRLGRELHDSTGQLLVALSMSVAHLRHSRDPGQADEILDEIDEAVQRIDREIRTFSFIHYPAELGENDLVAALEIFARSFGKRTGLQVTFQSCCKKAQTHPAIALALLRIAQEAMTNVHRHARASLVRLSLAEHRGIVELSIKDDGCGLPLPDCAGTMDGVGLLGMRHRIEHLGGHFRIRRMKQGTKVTAGLTAARFYKTGPLLGCSA